MVSEEEMELLKRNSMSPERARLCILIFVCLVTAMLAGFTAIAMNGDIDWTAHHEYLGSEWDEEKVIHIGWATQGVLAFSTMAFFLLSIYLLMMQAVEKGKGPK